ncbi:hypothetical protein [Streptosporangium minutum]|nr:hypothetical protein [Streptosporangium minutum]
MAIKLLADGHAEECITCSAPITTTGSDYCGELCQRADETGEQRPDW